MADGREEDSALLQREYTPYLVAMQEQLLG
jgi:hypothetical protein